MNTSTRRTFAEGKRRELEDGYRIAGCRWAATVGVSRRCG
jgi:hypothetical protein